MSVTNKVRADRPAPHATRDGIIDQKRAERERERKLLWYARYTFYAAVVAAIAGLAAFVVALLR